MRENSSLSPADPSEGTTRVGGGVTGRAGLRRGNTPVVAPGPNPRTPQRYNHVLSVMMYMYVYACKFVPLSLPNYIGTVYCVHARTVDTLETW